MARNFSKQKYLIAAGLTFGIFIMGVLLGLVVEGKRISMMQNTYDLQKSEFASSQLQFEYLGQLTSNNSCPVIYDVFSKSTLSLGQAQERLVEFEKKTDLNKVEFEILKRQYVVEEIRYYLFAKRAKDICKIDLDRVLYFYSDEKNCPRCKDQEFVLNYLKKVFKDRLLIFALDEQFEQEPMISVLKKQYNVTQFPTLIVEGEKLEGFISSDELKLKICDKFKGQIEDCPIIQSNQTLVNPALANQTLLKK